MIRLNLNVKFMVLIIRQCICVVCQVLDDFFCHCLASLLQGSYCCGSALGQWGNFTQNITSVSQVPHVIPSPLGFEADSEKDCNNVILHSFSMNSKYFLCVVSGVFSLAVPLHACRLLCMFQ